MSRVGNSPSNSIAPIIVAIALFIAGLIGVFLTIYYAGVEYGARLVFHDPGKYFFHVFLLPVSVWVFLNEFPVSLVTQLHKRRKVVISFLAFMGLILTVVGAFQDHYSGMCERISIPIDFSSEDTRETLLKIKIDGHEAMRNAANPDKFIQVSQEAYDKYKKALDEVRTGNCDYFRLSGPGQYWSLFLSFLGTLFVVSILWLLLVHFVARKKPSSEMLSAYLIIFSLIVPWLILRAYSEWYISFGTEFFTKTIFITGALALVMIGILFVLSLKKQGVQKIVASVLTAIAAFFSLVSLFKPEWFPFVAQVWHSLNISEMVIMYGIFIPTAGCLVYYVLDPEDSSNSSPTQEI